MPSSWTARPSLSALAHEFHLILLHCRYLIPVGGGECECMCVEGGECECMCVEGGECECVCVGGGCEYLDGRRHE